MNGADDGCSFTCASFTFYVLVSVNGGAYSLWAQSNGYKSGQFFIGQYTAINYGIEISFQVYTINDYGQSAINQSNIILPDGPAVIPHLNNPTQSESEGMYYLIPSWTADSGIQDGIAGNNPSLTYYIQSATTTSDCSAGATSSWSYAGSTSGTSLAIEANPGVYYCYEIAVDNGSYISA